MALAGKHDTLDEILWEALGLLREHEEIQRLRFEELRKAIAVGIEQADRGETEPLDMDEILAESRRRLAEEAANGNPRVRRTPEAKNDLLEILTRIGRTDPRAAARLSAAINEKLDLLTRFPYVGIPWKSGRYPLCDRGPTKLTGFGSLGSRIRFIRFTDSVH